MIDEDVRNQQNSLERVKKVCKRISSLVKIFAALFCVVWILLIVAIICSLIDPAVFGGEGETSPVLLVKVVLLGAVIVILLKAILGLFSDASNGKSPFSLPQVKRLRFVALCLVIYTALEFLLALGSATMQIGGVSTGYLPIDGNGNMIVPVDFAPLVAASVVFAFSFVFEYGVLLQEFSDETL